ncbi:SpoIIE family protein phosphatase [Streptomyces sp. Tu 2975]|uniref:ATP-binding SpoIIE family protein phosphatase n=1 Tax=Streptomyces sp. Tu 2975 TaxID=2676871 RepID=UPI00135C1035|nr:SpoIIE family protein phosphatase [Streptomyces sp. Tu 2975]QIP87976.1 SpoIIE family protein phosphatase [Streptomyces sp. Tu 2975]
MSTSGHIVNTGSERPEDSAVLVLDHLGRVLACTGGAVELTGLSAGELQGRAVEELLTDPGVWSALRDHDPGVHSRSVRTALLHADGSRRVQLDLLPVDGPLAARYLMRLVPAADADRREENDALLRALFSQTGIGLAVYDSELRLIRGISLPSDPRPSALLAGRRLGELLVPEDAAALEERLHRVVATGDPLIDFVTTARLSRTPERDRIVSLSALRMAGRDGMARGVAVTFTDVTEQERERSRASLVATAASALGRSLEVGRNTQVLADLLVPAFADLACVDITEALLVGEEPGEFVTGAPLRRVSAVAGGGEWPDPLYPQGSVIRVKAYESDRLRGGSAVIVPDLDELRPRIARDPERRRLVLAPGAASYMVVPLQARGHVLGAVSVWRSRARAPFDTRDAAVAEDICSRAALAIDNARRYTRERRTAESLQRSLLPRPVLKVTAAETAGVYVPGRTLAGTGGSWFDVITLSSSRVAFVVGNLRGHGLNAAAAMGSLRTAVRTLADLDPPPDELLTHLDDLVVRLADDEQPGEPEGTVRGATCLYAVYDPVSARALMASAGHAAPVLARSSGDTGPVDLLPGPALGLEGAPFEPVEVALSPGDLLAFTAGSLSDAPGSGAGHVIDHLREVRGTGTGDAAAVPEIARDLLVPFLAHPPDDDAALLLARVSVSPEGSVVDREFPADVRVVSDARALVAERLTVWGLDELVFTTELIVSELLTNAIRYAGGPVRVRLIRDQRLVCEVSDPSETQPHLRRARLTDEGGRGLFLIAQLAHRWGSRNTAAGKTIWTEQLLP